MKAHHIHYLFLAVGFFIISTAASWAGQVVTEDVKQWAKQAVEEEKTLETATGKKTLAVLYFENNTGNSGLDPLQKGLTLMLITDLSTLQGLHVVERVRMQAITEELGLGVSGLVDPDSAPRVGRLLGAEWLVGGELREKDKFPIHIASNLLDVPSPQVLGQPTADGLLEEFFRMEKELLFKIIEILKVELTEEERERLNKPFTTDIKALIDIARALQASDRGNYEQAERYYERALLRDPDISPVRTYIKELQTLGKVGPAGTKTRQMLQTIRNETSLTDQKTTTEVTRREDSPKDTSVPITIQVPVPSLGP